MKTQKSRNWLIILFSLTCLASISTKPNRNGQQPREQTSFFVSPGGSGSACSMATPCPLQTALDNLNGGDIIYLASGTYQKANPATEVILVDKSIQLYGGWNGQAGALIIDPDLYISVIDGQDARRCIKVIAGGAGSKLSGLTLTNGFADPYGGGIYSSASSLTITRIKFRDNISGSMGGGIFLANNGGMTLSI